MSSDSKESRLIYFDTVQQTPVRWLWPGYIPLNKVSCIVGDSGNGKTTLALTLAALMSNGRGMPLSVAVPIIGNTIYQSAEDGAADTLKPRLVCAGADCSKIAFIEAASLNIDSDCEVIEKHIREMGASLICFDPVQAYTGKAADLGRAGDMRRLMTNLGQIAERNNCTVLILCHLNKTLGSKELYRVLGSVDITAAARSVLLIHESNADPETHVITHIKNSLGPKGVPIAFRIDDGPAITFLGEYTEEDADTGDYEAYDSKSDQAAGIIQDLLTDGPRLATDVYKACDKNGISARTVERVKKDLGIRSVRKEGAWYWAL